MLALVTQFYFELFVYTTVLVYNHMYVNGYGVCLQLWRCWRGCVKWQPAKMCSLCV